MQRHSLFQNKMVPEPEGEWVRASYVEIILDALKDIAEDDCGCCNCAETARAALAALALEKEVDGGEDS